MYSRLFAIGVAVCATSFCVPAQAFGAVYTMTNASPGNEVAVALRLPWGGMVPFANYSTGGDGNGAGLGSQAALAMTADDHWLLAVNAGSDELTLFRVFSRVFLWQRDVVPSGGAMPTSVAVHGDLVYVLNAGADNVCGFRIQAGSLQSIPGASYSLSQAGAAAGQVGFDPSGQFLVVTERATDTIDVFPVAADGTLGAILPQPSNGMTPFGFQFNDQGTLVVSEAAGGAPGASTCSSYELQSDGTLVSLTAAAPTMQAAACWIAIPHHGHYAYSTNFASGSLSGFRIHQDGTLTLLDASGITAQLPAGGGPLDADFDPRGRVLFVLDAGNDEVDAFWRDGQGGLTQLPGSWSLPDHAAGLLAR